MTFDSEFGGDCFTPEQKKLAKEVWDAAIEAAAEIGRAMDEEEKVSE